MRRPAPRILTIPPGVPFAATLADALATGRIVEDFRLDPADPLGLAEATIFVPTRRAARALRSAFVDRTGGASAILPTIRPLGDVDEDAGFFEAELPAALTLAPPIAGIDRLIELANLIMAWKRALPEAVHRLHKGSPLAAPANPADAIWLARGLADLLDAMETEERPWSALEALDAAEHAAWWQLTIEFLKIATAFWPARLAELGRMDAAAHRDALIRAEAERLRAKPPAGPVIVAGSTGSLPATAALIAAVATLERGAIVLPGLDLSMDEAQWQLSGLDPEAASGGSERAARLNPATRSHPQYGLFHLLSRLGVERDAVVPLDTPAPEIAARNALVSLALLPAAATADWAAAESATLRSEAAVAEALAGIDLIEAANEREEAQAIAVAMRLALEGDGDKNEGEDATTAPAPAPAPALAPEPEGPTVALVTPDRNLARRVAAELARFGIAANDSGGVPLAASDAARLFSLTVQVALRPGDPTDLLALLRHPLARFGLGEAEMRRAADVIELVALRGGTGEIDMGSFAGFFDARRRVAEERRHKPAWLDRIPAEDLDRGRALADRIDKALAPLFSVLTRPAATAATGRPAPLAAFPISHWARRSAEAVENVAREGAASAGIETNGLWPGEAGERLADLIGALIGTTADFQVSDEDWTAMVPALLAGEMVKPRGGGHPRCFIWGALEARLQSVDTIVLGGLNEGTWPGQTVNDALLSRGMKTAIGLEPPERRTGQAAHDVEMALGTRRVILSRAARSASAPSVPSRWLQRLCAVIGKDGVTAMRARGSAYIAWGEALDAPDAAGDAISISASAAGPAERPEPRPPHSYQPKSYSFSEVKTLRRDPYAIYARRILRLDPLDPLVRDPAAAERGTLYHKIIERFTRACPDAAAPEAEDLLAAIADEEFARALLPPHVATVWRPLFARVAGLYLDWERNRPPRARREVEAWGAFTLPATGVELSGLADRIDLLADGGVEIIDYKTGSSPSLKEARALLDPQLPLEAAALAHGAFTALGPLEASALTYVRLRPGDALKAESVAPDRKGEIASAAELGREALQRFEGLVSALATGRRGFASRVIPASARDYAGAYDHLARVAEWAIADSDDGEAADG